MKVALYARVSTDEQARDGHSIGAQKKKLQQYAELNEWGFNFYVDDGYSAKDFNRPQIKSLLEGIVAGDVNALVVFKLDRLTRNVKNLHELIEILDKHGCKLISITESLDTSSAGGRFFITMLGAMAQWERETIGERTLIGLKEAANKDIKLGRVPVGYVRENGVIRINEGEATVIRGIFEDYATGKNAEMISIDLQRDESIKSLNRNWTTRRISQIIDNRNYIGESKVTFKDGDTCIQSNFYPQIIDLELFDEVQSIREARKSMHPRQKSSRSERIFSGILRCTCGAPVVGTHKRDLRYRCSDVASLTCKRKTFMESRLEEVFIAYMVNIINKLNAGDYSELTDENIGNTRKAKQELEKVRKVKNKNHIAFENDLISLADYKARIQELNAKEEILMEAISTEKKPPQILSMDMQDFKSLWAGLEPMDKRTLILKIIKKITVSDEGATTLTIEAVEFV